MSKPLDLSCIFTCSTVPVEPVSLEQVVKIANEFEKLLDEQAKKLLPKIVEQWGLEDAKALLMSAPVGQGPLGCQLRQSRRLGKDCVFMISDSSIIKIEGLKIT